MEYSGRSNEQSQVHLSYAMTSEYLNLFKLALIIDIDPPFIYLVQLDKSPEHDNVKPDVIAVNLAKLFAQLFGIIQEKPSFVSRKRDLAIGASIAHDKANRRGRITNSKKSNIELLFLMLHLI